MPETPSQGAPLTAEEQSEVVQQCKERIEWMVKLNL